MITHKTSLTLQMSACLERVRLNTFEMLAGTTSPDLSPGLPPDLMRSRKEDASALKGRSDQHVISKELN